MSVKSYLENSLKDIISNNENSDEVIAYLLDNSGSTGNIFRLSSILEKSKQVVKELSLLNRNGKNLLFTFSCNAKFISEIKISQNGTVMFPPGIIPEGSTNTDIGFQLILSKVEEFKITKVILITDGDTNSLPYLLQRSANSFHEKKVDIEIIAISARNIDFNRLSSSEEKSIPGLDVVNIMNKPAKIYTPLNPDIPYELAKSVDSSTKCWTLLEISISKLVPLPILITRIINDLIDCDIDFTTETIQEELQTLFIEIGMLLGKIYVKFPENFLESILKDLESKTNADLSEFVLFGFDLKKQNVPFIRTNIQRRIIDHKTQQTSFHNATDDLRIKGTSLGEEAITFADGVICVMKDPSKLTINNGFSIDAYGNTYFSFGTNEQAIRQGMRSFCGEKKGFRDSRNSPSVIFFIISKIFLFLICCPELNLDDSYIKILLKLARIQCGQKKQEKDRSYSNSFLEEWEDGNIPLIHFSRKETHADLHTDKQINEANLNPSEFWAIAMIFLGEKAFESQKPFFQAYFESENISINRESILAFLREKYSSKVTGTVKFLTIDEKKSVITLEDFPDGITIFQNQPHTTNRGYLCDTKTHYSLEERAQLGNKCVWCNKTLEDHQFVQIASINEAQLTNNDPPKFIQQQVTFNHSAQQNVTNTHLNTGVFTLNTSVLKRVVIVMEGTVGAGKTTVSQRIQDKVEQMGGYCANESTDKYCKTGMQTKDAIKKVTAVLRGISRIRNNLIFVIIDTCGERNTGNTFFNVPFDGWLIHRIRPNFELSRIRQYFCWSLRNVLLRPLHSRDTNYWLNPESATVSVCKKVHSDKSRALFGSNFIEVSNKSNLHDILNDIENEALQYEEFLSTSMPLNVYVDNLIATFI